MTGEHAEKRRRVLALLDAEGLDALVLRRPGNVAWYSCGGRTHVLATPEVGVADVVVRRDGAEVVTAVNEVARLESEELTALDASFRVLPWSADRDAALPTGDSIGADAAVPGTRPVAPAVERLRRSLTDAEVERYRRLGRDAAEALTHVCGTLDPAASEHEAAARAGAALLERGIDPVVLLVAGAGRLPRHRHPLPTDAPLGGLAMLVVCGRRHGLVASLTRFVSFGGLDPLLAETFDRLLCVDVAFDAATRPGERVGAVFARGTAAYAEHGFDAGEWRLHHQGGPTGYEARDYLADADSAAVVEPAQAFAWNPSVPSLKSEDTILALEEGPEILTLDPGWPAREVEGLLRPLVLER